MILEVFFLSLVFWKFFSNCQIFLCWKTWCLAISRLTSRVDALPSKSRSDLTKFQFLHKFRLRVCDLDLTHEIFPYAFTHFSSDSRVTDSQNAWKSVLKGWKWQFFQKICFLVPHDSLSLNHQNSSKLNQSCLDFVSWTTLK